MENKTNLKTIKLELTIEEIKHIADGYFNDYMYYSKAWLKEINDGRRNILAELKDESYFNSEKYEAILSAMKGDKNIYSEQTEVQQ